MPSASGSFIPSGFTNIHRYIRCDECNMNPIIGIRYKCTGREDYDLCEKCESKKIQPYPMIKIIEPLEVKTTPAGPPPSLTPPAATGGVLSSASQLRWDRSISNKDLLYTNDNRTVERPGSVSCYPAAFVKFNSNICEFHIVIDKASKSSNWLTFGVVKYGFENVNSDGIGRTENSWGLCDDRGNSTGQAFVGSCGREQTKFRKFSQGDILSVRINTSHGELELALNGSEFYSKISIPTGNASDYWFAMSFANDHRVTILPPSSYPAISSSGSSSSGYSSSSGFTFSSVSSGPKTNCRRCGKALNPIAAILGMDLCETCL